MNAQFVSSLAKTGKQYVMCQAAPDGNSLHVQIPASNFAGKNRPYGYTFDLTVEPSVLSNVRAALKAVENKRSMAGTTRKYLPMQVTTIGYDGALHFQAQDGALNRKYGLAFTRAAKADIVDAIAHILDLADYEAPEPLAPAPAPKLIVKPALSIKSSDYRKVTVDEDEPIEVTFEKGGIQVELTEGETIDVTEDGSFTFDDGGDTKVVYDREKEELTVERDNEVSLRISL